MVVDNSDKPDAWVDFSWPRPRASLGGTFSGGAMREETHDDDMVR